MYFSNYQFFSIQELPPKAGFPAITLVVALLLILSPDYTFAQTSVRSPWRASFTELNRDAASQVRGPGWQPAQSRSQGTIPGTPDAPANRPPALDLSVDGLLGNRPENLPGVPANRDSGSSSKSGSNAQRVRVANASSATTGLNEANTTNAPARRTVAGAAVSRSMNSLPNDAGQVWREYDIASYTSKVTSVDNPQQALLDWVLRETGTEMWFNQPLGILHATKARLIVYHTPEIQSAVKDIVDRFVRTRGQLQSFNVNLVTVGNPDWRSRAYPLLQTVDVKSPGVEAWLISKENAAILFNQLKNRSDFKQHSAGTVNTHDGQSFVLEKTKPVPFVRSIRWLPGQFPGYEPLMTTINEGYTVGLSPLMSLDNQSVEITIKCDVDQVESLTPVRVPVGGPNNTVNNVDLNVPKVISWRLHERFRWPADQVLLLSSGVVADPQPESGAGLGPLRALGLGTVQKKVNRSDALLMIEYRGPSTGASLPRSAGRSRMQPLTNR